MHAVLLAAGDGTRIRSLFPDTPKALIKVGGCALIDHLLANLVLDDYLRGGGNRDAPTAGRDVGSRGQWATRDFGSSFRRWRAAKTSTAC